MKVTLKKLRSQWQYHLLLVPGVVLTFIFCYIPLYGIVIAFQDFNPALGFASKWVGWKNFDIVFSQPNFIRTIWNTLYMSVFKIVGGIVVPVTFALLLNEISHNFTRRVFQTLIYLPHFLSWVILAGVMKDILGNTGIINQMLNAIGLGSIGFLSNDTAFPITMIVTDIWKGFGYGTIVYLAAISGIDPELYEAAIMDGARKWKQTLYITIPLLAPTIILMTVLALGGVLNGGFDQIVNMYSPAVYSSGDIIDTYVYRQGIESANYSVATAVGLFKSLISAILVLISHWLADKVAGYKIF